uniref:NADH-ubiquinone oxidoreductase chain 4 n=1 Tax=Alicella gigantea TaxID=1315966 RepID=A0A5B7L311_9CRUS|nr:NADH dehydrogenase subunit 4 [Alicella gigantea]QAT19468.1 NADH dehydrogenase subunit 4 [Alicella gigantea]
MMSVISILIMSMVLSGLWGEVLLFMGVMFMSMVLCGSDLGGGKITGLIEVDNLGLVLISLSVWVVGMSFLGSMQIKNLSLSSASFVFISLILLLSLVFSFSFSDYLLFYLSFETCLIPILFMILGWGYQPERAQAGVYMLFYTLLGSLPLFFMIMYIKMKQGLGNMYMVDDSGFSSVIMYLFLVVAFLVKFPMYSVHLWLLKAHVEAPVAGSMILAGVLLKLGGYGLIRVLPLCVSCPSVVFNFIISMSLWGGVVVSLGCLRQIDMKLLVACSSVVHMGSCVGGLFVLSEWGYKGAVGMMVGHGLCSSGLFYLVNLVYERTHSRSMLISKGLLNLMPAMSLWWFLMLSANMSAPPSLNLLSEIMLIVSLVSWSSWSMLMLAMMAFFSASYSIYLFSLSQHGAYLLSKSGFHSGGCIEYLVVFLHWVPLNLLVLSFYCIS